MQIKYKYLIAKLYIILGYESEYHYGSDFGDSTDKSDDDNDMLLMSPNDSDSLSDNDNDSDSDFSISSFSATSLSQQKRAPSPEPLWLQAIDLPTLALPPSSDDLLVPLNLVLKVVSIYENIRRFRNLVRLSPFRLEDFCAALMCEDQSPLLTEIHIMLLKAILREEDSQATHFGPLDQKDSFNISLYLIDSITWPEVLRIYVESDTGFDKKVLNILSNKEYPYTNVEDRLYVLQFLSDQFLITTPIRDVMLQEGPIHYDDHCRICHRLGDLLCCETCPAVFHLDCVDPPLINVPTEDWQCNLCKTHKTPGVTDCISTQEKQGLLCRHEHLGFDRHGRKYWFICRRVFVENENGDEVWYYSTPRQLENLLSVLDDRNMELALCREFTDFKDEMIRQMKITEDLTNESKGNKKSYFELEAQNSEKPKSDEEVANELARNDSDMDIDEEISNSNDSKNNLTRVDGELRLTRNKVNQINNGTLYFKLGMENAFKNYVNHYVTNVSALNKPQRNEERDKKRHLSHKFSLTTASECKWMGVLNGLQSNIISSLKQTLLSLEQSISVSFMHPNWPNIKKLWVQAVTKCESPKDFAKIIIIYQFCLKPALFANVWHEHLGHLKLQRITSAEREEKKKLEKREKRERDDEEERNRNAFNFIKYSFPIKHQIWKQKGEEYRVHGQWGWIWMSNSRRQSERFIDCNKITPVKIMTRIKEGDKDKIISVDPDTHDYIKEFAFKRTDDITNGIIPDELKDIQIVDSLDKFEEIDVSHALTTAGRILYPKIARKSKLDDFLARRVHLKDVEERKLSLAKSEPDIDIDNEDIPEIATHHMQASSYCVERQLLKMIGKDKLPLSSSSNSQTSQINIDLMNAIAKRIQTVRLHYSELNRLGKQFKCYSRGCDVNTMTGPASNVTSCYSPICLQKSRVKKELYLLIRKVHSSGVGKKPSILEQKLTEGKKEGDGKVTDDNILDNIGPNSDEITKDLNAALKNSIACDASLILSSVVLIKPEKISSKIEMTSDEIPKVKSEIVTEVQSEESVPDPSETVDIKEEEIKVEDVSVDDSLNVTTSDDNKDDPLIKTPESKRMKLEDDEESFDNSNVSVPLPPPLPPIVKPRMSTRGRPPKIKTVTTTSTTTTSRTTTTKYVDGMLDSMQSSGSSLENFKVDVNGSNKFQTQSEMKFTALRTNRRFGFSKIVRKEEKKYETETTDDGRQKIYSTVSSYGRVYLKKLVPDSKTKHIKATQFKYPIISNFSTNKLTKSMMVLPRYELQKLARHGGKMIVPGYHNLAKNNSSVWPYPCSRPLFKTCWLYRTINVKTLSAVALQLRIMWACLRWDDMSTKPPTSDGKHQVTTETEIMSLELLKHRFIGKFMEKTQYLRRKVVIPLELPKTIRGS